MNGEVITPEYAKELMDLNRDLIILDVREDDEYKEGHVPGAVLLPYTEIDEKAEEMFPDKSRLILVYCRSGRRSAVAVKKLIALGYTNIKDFGGILSWPYDIVR